MDQTYMKEKPILPLLLSMALPMVISMFVNSLYNIIDSIFVAKISEDAMTALSLVYPVQNLINSIAVGFGVGINAVIAMFLGAGKAKEADKTATQGLFLNVIHGILLTIVGLMIMPSFLAMFTNDQTVIGMGLQYSTIALMFSTIIMASISFEKIFQASWKYGDHYDCFNDWLHCKYCVRSAFNLWNWILSETWNSGCSTCNRYRTKQYIDPLSDCIYITPNSCKNQKRLLKARSCLC